jgi:hypothetical protein
MDPREERKNLLPLFISKEGPFTFHCPREQDGILAVTQKKLLIVTISLGIMQRYPLL